MPSDRFDKLRPLRFAQHLALAAQVLELKRFLAMQLPALGLRNRGWR